MTLTGWIIYNGFLPGNKFIDYAMMLKEAAEERGHLIILKKNDEIFPIIPLTNIHKMPDYVLFTDKDIYLARYLEKLGVRLFNSASTIEICDDKIKTYERLAQENLPIPITIVAPKTFQQNEKLSDEFLSVVEEKLGLPYIVKENFGSFGEQVHLIQSKDALINKLQSISEPFMFQQFIATSAGVDVRLQVVGEKVVAAIKRKANNDFRANVTAGGTMVSYEPSTKEKELAIEANRAVGADFSGVDLLFGPNDTRVICEVNSNAHIRNLFDCTRINAAKYIIAHIEKEIMKIKNF